jgi:3-hydroxyacyl-[acyl-carrier protein] dehydratase/trans-2-decenoyl-[acyl-carrier protein] isomerase
MKYDDFRARHSFSKQELLAFAAGRLVEDAPALFAARLPLPPMLMIDRITTIRTEGTRGRIVAERAVDPGDWFFACHFAGDPVQPGCLGVDAVWQLLGFFCAWRGGLGAGRALGCGTISFEGQIRPSSRLVRYEVDVRRATTIGASGPALAIGDATVFVDGVSVYEIAGARVGLFPELAMSARQYATTDAAESAAAVPHDAASLRGDLPIGQAWPEASR